MKLFSARPSPAIVLAVVALVFAMAGSAVAGTDGLSSKITKSKVKKIAKKQINKAAPNLSVAHADTADQATNATNATNATTAGIGLSPVAYATVDATGDVIEARSRGVADGNVTLEATSAYCFRGLGFEFKTVQTTPVYVGFDADVSVEASIPPDVGFIDDCDPDGEQLEVATNVDSEFAAHSFFIWFYN